MKFKAVMRYDGNMKLYRLFRVIFKRGKGAGFGGKNYHAALKAAITRKIFSINIKANDIVVSFLFLRFTYERSYGGIMV